MPPLFRSPAVSVSPQLLLPADAASVWYAREFTADRVGLWGLGALRDAAVLVVSELVTNAVRACGGWPAWVVLRLGLTLDGLLVEVWDPSADPPVPVAAEVPDEPAVLPEGGRGLALVAACAAAWGHYPVERPGGKVVWARLALPEGYGLPAPGESDTPAANAVPVPEPRYALSGPDAVTSEVLPVPEFRYGSPEPTGYGPDRVRASDASGRKRRSRRLSRPGPEGRREPADVAGWAGWTVVPVERDLRRLHAI